MGFLDTVRDALALPAAAAAPPLESPWASPNHLLPVLVDDRVADTNVTRSTAMRVPAAANRASRSCA